jgi:hypothetical protein
MQPPTQWIPWALSLGVKWPVCEADHSPPSTAKVKNAWSYTFTPQYAFMAWCLVKKAHGQLYLYHTCMLTAYWEGLLSKYSCWTAMPFTQQCCHWWNSYYRTTFSATVTFVWMSSVSWNLCPFKSDFEVIQSQIRGKRWVLHFSNWSLGQKLLDSECLASYSIVMVEDPITGPKFRPSSVHSFT